jgi:hypothetical protein
VATLMRCLGSARHLRWDRTPSRPAPAPAPQTTSG